MNASENVLKVGDCTDQSSQNRTYDKALSEAQNRYISYKAVAGMLVEVGSSTRKISKQEFADSLGYNVRTLLRWETDIPNFWQRVKERREAIGGRDMVANVWSRVYLDAMAGKAEQQKLWLGQFDNWRPPAQAHDVQMTGWADVLTQARRRKKESEQIKHTQIIDITD